MGTTKHRRTLPEEILCGFQGLSAIEINFCPKNNSICFQARGYLKVSGSCESGSYFTLEGESLLHEGWISGEVQHKRSGQWENPQEIPPGTLTLRVHIAAGYTGRRMRFQRKLSFLPASCWSGDGRIHVKEQGCGQSSILRTMTCNAIMNKTLKK